VGWIFVVRQFLEITKDAMVYAVASVDEYFLSPLLEARHSISWTL
jgi:hypothetical protein